MADLYQPDGGRASGMVALARHLPENGFPDRFMNQQPPSLTPQDIAAMLAA